MVTTRVTTGQPRVSPVQRPTRLLHVFELVFCCFHIAKWNIDKERYTCVTSPYVNTFLMARYKQVRTSTRDTCLRYYVNRSKFRNTNTVVRCAYSVVLYGKDTALLHAS